MNRYLQEKGIPQWMTKGKTTLIQKDPPKKPPQTTRPITCQPLTRNILTVQIREEIYDSLIGRGLFPKNRKGTASGPEVQESYSRLISASSRRERRDGKI